MIKNKGVKHKSRSKYTVLYIIIDLYTKWIFFCSADKYQKGLILEYWNLILEKIW